LAQLARVEGIVADPVYTAKALAAVLSGSGLCRSDGPVVFWHTGGVPATLSDTGLAPYLEEQECAGIES
jgi:1-aminocyclopropane-1-carboxylate deaminase/D-cysteine desulfhydrase